MGKTWSNSTRVIVNAEPWLCIETIAGKWFPSAYGGRGGMVIICDGPKDLQLASFISPNMSSGFQPTVPSEMMEHPPWPRGPLPVSPEKGTWGPGGVAFIPDSSGEITNAFYSLWTETPVYSQHKKAM